MYCHGYTTFLKGRPASECLLLLLFIYEGVHTLQVVGVAFSDFSSQELKVCQFIENDNLSNFEVDISLHLIFYFFYFLFF